jgi:hypothetical protein
MKNKKELVVVNNEIEKVSVNQIENQSDVSVELNLLDAVVKDLLTIQQELSGIKHLEVYKTRIDLGKSLAGMAAIRKDLRRR